MQKNSFNVRIFILILLLLSAISIWTAYLKEPDNNLHIFALDVGQGDALLIQKQNFQILIDGGPDTKVIEELSKVMPLEDKKIELVILTHPHADHITGLVEVLKRYEVEDVVFEKIDYESNIYKEFLSEIERKNIPTEDPKKGKTDKLTQEIEIKYLWPGDEVYDNLNDNSVVFQLKYQDFSAFFPSDCELKCWEGVLADNQNLKSQILKVAHHGSKNGTTKEAVERVQPKHALISLAKDNKYGFPHNEVISILNSANISIFRTDIMGVINVSTDGRSFTLQ